MIIKEHENGNLIEVNYEIRFYSKKELNKFIKEEMKKWKDKGFWRFAQDVWSYGDNVYKLWDIWFRKEQTQQ